MMISYAQNFEDVLLERVFKGQAKGFYVDVGAHDPEEFSVTKHFYDKGWSGLNIEPVRASQRKFIRQRPRDINLGIAAGDTTGRATIFQPTDTALASLSKEIAQRAIQDTDSSGLIETQVEIRPLASVLEEYEVTHIDFLKIDVEGWEAQVLAGMDFSRFRPVILLVEATRPLSGLEDFTKIDEVAAWAAWEPRLLRAGYKFAFFDGLNRFYIRKEDQALKACFSIPVGHIHDRFVHLREHQAREDSRSAAARLAHVAGEKDALALTVDRLVSEIAATVERLTGERERIATELSGKIEILEQSLASVRGERQNLEFLMTAEIQKLEQSLASVRGERQDLESLLAAESQKTAQQESALETARLAAIVKEKLIDDIRERRRTLWNLPFLASR
ncbi:MAG: FkbM family methyltransferase [Betaproteobacteria bacterium]|nr:FkbM family methyltransferase [Betaproteobacteria bacterium]